MKKYKPFHLSRDSLIDMILRWPTSVTAKQNCHNKIKKPRQNKKVTAK